MKINPKEASKESLNYNVNKQESGDPSVFTKSYQTEESCNAEEIKSKQNQTSNESIKPHPTLAKNLDQSSEISPINNSGKSERAQGS